MGQTAEFARRAWPAVVLVLAGLCAGGCNTAFGNYFANRGRDFGDMFRAEVSIGTGITVGAGALGVLHAGAGVHLTDHVWGWRYGEGRNERPQNPSYHAGAATNHYIVHGVVDGKFSHVCFLLLPGLFSRTGDGDGPDPWMWFEEGSAGDHWAWAHVFDVDVEVFLLKGGIALGFSPAEFFDFLLGWFGLDLAGDDRPLAKAGG